MKIQDPKRVVGNRVHSSAWHVIGDKSPHNRYRSLWKETFVSGTVKGIVTAKVNLREQVSADVLWDVGERTRRRTVKVIIMRTGDAPFQNEPPLVEHKDPQANQIAVVAEDDEVDGQEGQPTVSHLPTLEFEPSPSFVHPIDVHGYHWHFENVQAPKGVP
jgi:hypothetical protein